MAVPSHEELVFNLRKLPGGQSCRIYRSATPGDLARTAPELLGCAHVNAVLDLREAQEIHARPSVVPEHHTYINVPLYRQLPPPHLDLRELYHFITTRCQSQLAAALKVVAHYAAEGLLLHCNAGKDRTGIVTAIALAIAGVDRDEIVADYALSGEMLPDSYRAQIASELSCTMELGSEEFTRALASNTESPAGVMVELLDRMEHRHGSIQAYAAAIGVTADELKLISAAINGREAEIDDELVVKLTATKSWA